MLDRVKHLFANDRFAVHNGIEIVEVEPGCALCRMPLQPFHMNANNTPMGGAIFTLADLAFAAAANTASEQIVVSQHVSITFLSPTHGKELIAEAKCIKNGRRTCLYEVLVTDETGTKVAYATGNGFAL